MDRVNDNDHVWVYRVNDDGHVGYMGLMTMAMCR